MVSEAADAFGSKAAKLGAVLGIASRGRVLTVGETPWQDDLISHFPRLERVGSESELQGCFDSGATYDLILWRSGGEQVVAPLSDWGARMRDSLKRSGSLLVFADNPIAPRRLRAPWRHLKALLSPGLPGTRRALVAGGFNRIEEYLVHPRIETASDFVHLRRGGDRNRVMIPLHRRWLGRLGIARWLHDGFLLVASGGEGGFQTFLSQAEARSRASSRSRGGGDWVIERFCLRARGALVGILGPSCRENRARVVSRVTTTGPAQKMVAHNFRWIGRFHAAPRIPTELKRVVPEPLFEIEMDDYAAFFETAIEGAMAFEVIQNAEVERKVFEGCYRFIRDFNESTATRMRVTPEFFARLAPSPSGPWIDEEMRRLISDLRGLLFQRAGEQERTVVWAHRDFHYGNAMVDPESGTLRGIIDWERAGQDFAGVDLLELVIRRERLVNSATLIEALRRHAPSFVAGGFRGIDEGLDYEDRFPLNPELRRERLGWLVWRATERATLYPAVYRAAPEAHRAVAGWACMLLATSSQ